jgi:hypothetical protein
MQPRQLEGICQRPPHCPVPFVPRQETVVRAPPGVTGQCCGAVLLLHLR